MTTNALPTEGSVRVTFDKRGRFQPSRTAMGEGRLDDGRRVLVAVDRTTWECMSLAFALGTDAVYTADVPAWRIVRPA